MVPKNSKTFLAAFFFAITTSFGQFTHQDSLRGGLSIQRRSFDVYFYDLEVKIDIANKSISGVNTIYFKQLMASPEIQLDLFANMVIDSVTNSGQKLDFTRDGKTFYVINDTFAKEDPIKVFYHGSPTIAAKPPWDGGFVWSGTKSGNNWVGVTCEGTGASLWWPCKDHPSDEPDSMRISIQVPNSSVEKGESVVSNGNLQSVKFNANGYTSFTWKVNYPINTYNVTFYLGPYKHITDYLKGLKLDYYLLKSIPESGFKHLESSKRMLNSFVKLFGPYPFPKDGYKLVQSPYWGMEHQSAIAYGNDFTNNDFGFDFIIVHESAHEWWGNSLSCADHAELWIHESFATYAEALYVEDQLGYSKMIEYLNFQKGKIKNRAPVLGPLGVNYNEWEDTDKYYKGSWMLHTLRNLVDNDTLWFSTIKKLATDYKHKIVTSQEVINYFSKALNQDLNPYFYQYLKSAKPPILEYYWTKNESRASKLFFRLVSDEPQLKMTLKAKYKSKLNMKLVAENNWKEVSIQDKDQFSWSADLYYVDFQETKTPKLF